MIRKTLFVLSILGILILLTTGLAAARDKVVNWVDVFQPADHGWEVPWWDIAWFHMIYAVEPFQNNLYVTVSGELGPQVFRSPNGVTWEAVSQFAFGNTIYEIYPAYFMTWDMIVYQEKLYVPVNDWGFWGVPGKLMRSTDGTNWEPVFEPTLEELHGGLPDKLGIFNGMLYLTTVSLNPASATTLIWRSPSGDPGTWEVVEDLGNDVNSTSSPTAFKGYVYISGYSNERGVLMWRSVDGLDWELIDVGIQGDYNHFDGNLAVFKGQLYFASRQWVYGGNIYRTDDGLAWEQVVDGFGQPDNNEDIQGLIVYKDDLYAPVYDDVCTCVRIFSSQTGDPNDWHELSTEGWPASWSYPERNAQAVFKDNLYIANSQVFGSLYRMDEK